MSDLRLVLLLLAACKPPVPTADSPATLRVVALNDFHGALYETPTRDDPARAHGGLPWLAGAVDALRADDPDILVLDGGDLFQGAWPVNVSKGLGSVRAFDLLGVDAAAIGNHEFDHGQDALRAAAREADFAWLTANTWHRDGGRFSPEGIAAWTTVRRKGLDIAVVGLTTVDTPQTTLRTGVADLEFRDPVDAVAALLPEIAATEPDVVALVAHLTGACEPVGYMAAGPPCTPGGEIGALIEGLPEGTFDVMVLGHAHTLLYHRVGPTFLLEQRANGHALGIVDLVVGTDGVDVESSALAPLWPLEHDAVDPGCGGGTFPIEPRDLGGRIVAPSEPALALVAELEADAGTLCEEVGCVRSALERTRERESVLGNLVADASLAAFPDADVAVMNAGGLRADLPAGPVRREHVQAVMPFDNRVLLVELSGARLATMFRIGVSGAHGLLHVAGATLGVDPSRSGGSDLDGNATIEPFETDRLCGATVGGQPLDPHRTYRVVVSDFLHGGGDHLGPALIGSPVIGDAGLLRDAIATYVAAAPGCLGDDDAPLPSADRIRREACSR